MGFQPPRGMADIGPEEMLTREWVYSRIKSVFKRYGFRLVEPSFVEEFETLSAKSGEEIRNEIYDFKDKSGRELGLRFDLTVGCSRMVAANPNWQKPVKLACISSMWRYDRPGYGRKRWFYQWNVEVFGVDGAEADAEVIALSIDILDELGLKGCEVLVGNREIAEDILQKAGVKQIDGALRTIDKIKKVSKEELYREFGKYGVDKKTADSVLEKLRAKNLAGLKKEKVKGVESLEKVFEYLGKLGKKAELDLTVVRGIGYYTGVVFEAYENGNPNLGALFGGGRYDSLVKIFSGKDMPATGCAGGIERALMALESQKKVPDFKGEKSIFVVPVGPDVLGEAIGIASALRETGLSASYDIAGRKLSKNLEWANSNSVSYCIIVGKRDLEEKKVTVRNMETGDEKKVELKKIAEFFA
ncbi:MAG: histidine--tRNA ligase [archaeon]